MAKKDFTVAGGIDATGSIIASGSITGSNGISGDMDADTYDPQLIAGDAFLRINHTGSIIIDTGEKITLTDAPIIGTDAANKTYVDNAIPTGIEFTANKNINNGYAGLNSSGILDVSVLPPITIITTQVAASEVDQLALTVQQGDVAVRTDISKSFIALNGNNLSLSDWQELLSPGDQVISVAGKIGTVTLASTDLTDVASLITTAGGQTIAGITLTGNLQIASTGTRSREIRFSNDTFNMGIDFTNNNQFRFIDRDVNTSRIEFNMDSGSANFDSTVSSPSFIENGTSLSSKYAILSANNSFAGNNQFSSIDTTGNYANAAVEIKEVNNVGNNAATNIPEYAPAMSFHWGGRFQGRLALETFQTLTWSSGASPFETDLYSLKTGNFESTVTTGVSPLIVASTTKVANLNVDLLDGYSSSNFARYIAVPNSSNSNGSLAELAWVASWGNASNVDHIWHDDSTNEWNFCSDTSFKAAGNSILKASVFKGQISGSIDSITTATTQTANNNSTKVATTAYADNIKLALVLTDTNNRVLALTDASSYIRMATTAASQITVPDNATVAFPIGTKIDIRQASASSVTFVAAVGVTINSPESLILNKLHTNAILIKIGVDEWDIIGDVIPL